MLFSSHVDLHCVSCVVSEEMTSWWSRPGMTSPLCMAQHPTLPAALALPLICPGWAATRLAGEQPWLATHEYYCLSYAKTFLTAYEWEISVLSLSGLHNMKLAFSVS